MKPTPTPPPAKLKARATTAFTLMHGYNMLPAFKADRGIDYPVAVVPCQSRKQAAALVRWFNLSEEERAMLVAKTLLKKDRFTQWTEETHYQKGVYLDLARAVLSLFCAAGAGKKS